MEFVTRTFDVLEMANKHFPKEDALAGKEKGKWKKYSIREYIDLANHISYGLLAMNINTGDRIAVITNNRPEWNIVDMGMSQIGAVSVPVYPTISQDEYHYILNHCKPKLIFISSAVLYNKILPIAKKLRISNTIYTFDKINGVNNWKDILLKGKDDATKYMAKLTSIKNSINPNDTVTLIYTSGTTGHPKGVLLSHKNIVSNFKTTAKAHHLGKNHRTLSFLPISHVYERMMNYHLQYKGISIYYAENMGTIVDNLKEVQPHLFITVPRLLEKVYDKIVSKGKELKGIKRKIFFWAVNVGLHYKLKNQTWWYKLKLSIARKLVFKKWLEALGGNVEIIVSGGASLQPRLEKVFWAAGIQILQGYGLTETSPVIAVNNPAKRQIKLGTVGPVIDDVEVKISKEGEILVKGPNIMHGYYRNEKLTNEVIDKEGWFHTGDVGEMVDNIFLRITDRKKEIFKLSSGKYIAPQVIENKLKESIFIEQVMVIGENQKYASAIVSPNLNYLHNWAYHENLDYRDNEELIMLPHVQSLYKQEINSLNTHLGEHEQIKRIKLVCEEWSPETGELSPTLKLKRDVITEKYQDVIDSIYNLSQEEKGSVIGKLTSQVTKGLKTGIDSLRKRTNQ